jgi:Mat/Ecp fimbriae outer membrane usher protein
MHSSLCNLLSRQVLITSLVIAALLIPAGEAWGKSKGAASDAAADDPVITIKPPPGFESDDILEETIIDIIFDGQKVASAPARFDLESISFTDPEGLAALLPSVRDRVSVLAALSKSLPQNREQLCSSPEQKSSARLSCGYLQPEIVGVIFDPGRLEAHLFISELYTYGRDKRTRYLPPPSKGAGLIAVVDARGFYDFNTDRTTLNSNLNFITGYGRWSLRGNIFANSQSGANLRWASANFAGRMREASLGFLPFRNGSTLARSDRLVGMRIGSTLKTRLDQSSLRVSEIPILVTASANVEVFRDGKLIDVQRVEPSQPRLDTSRLPGGSYEILLRITEGSQTREETRFFTSGSNLPPQGAPQWYLELGFPTQNSIQNDFFPNLNSQPVFNAGYSKRLNARLGVSGSVSVSERDQYAEASVFFTGPKYSLQSGIIASAKGDYGGFASASYQKDNWRFSGNIRNVQAKEEGGIITNGPYVPFPQSFSQASLRGSYKFENGRIGVRGFYRQTGTASDTYFGGPFIDYNIVKTGRSRVVFSAQAETGNDRASYFMGLRLDTRLKSPKPRRNTTLASAANIRTDSFKPTGIRTTREILETTMRTKLRQGIENDSEYFAGMRYEDSNAGVRAGLRKRTANVNIGLEARYEYQNQTNLFADLASGIALGGGQMAQISRFQESGAVVDIAGDGDAKYYVQGNGRKLRETGEGKSAFVPLRPFDIHDISIKSRNARNVEYENHADRLVLYPGNIPRIERRSTAVIIIVGRLLSPDGVPLGDATIRSDKLVGITDGAGYFQIDYSGNANLRATLLDNLTCELDLETILKNIPQGENFTDLGDVICK